MESELKVYARVKEYVKLCPVVWGATWWIEVGLVSWNVEWQGRRIELKTAGPIDAKMT